MALSDEREEAERLYVRQSMSCPAIAEQLKVDQGTVYRWKAEAQKKGEALDWDVQRRIYNMSPRELTAIYAESVKAWMIKIKANPGLLSDSKIADAISKHISVMQKIDTRGQYLGVAIDLIKVINIWLTENEPELKEKIEPHWDQIYEALKQYSTSKGIF
jgi:transposase-like protein